jgi:preprotein translocase subunit SecG
MENIYNFLKVIYIAVVIVFTVLVGSYVTEKSGLSGIMGGNQNLADKGIKKMTKQEIITNWATRLAILFFIISFLLFVMSSNLFKGF